MRRASFGCWLGWGVCVWRGWVSISRYDAAGVVRAFAYGVAFCFVPVLYQILLADPTLVDMCCCWAQSATLVTFNTQHARPLSK